jgi:hypothetical protein
MHVYIDTNVEDNHQRLDQNTNWFVSRSSVGHVSVVRAMLLNRMGYSIRGEQELNYGLADGLDFLHPTTDHQLPHDSTDDCASFIRTHYRH